MKNKKIKLSLNKETLQVMNEYEMNLLNGGEEYTSGGCVKAVVFVLTITAGGVDTSWWRCVPVNYGGEGIKSTWYQSGADTRPALDPRCEVPKFLY